MKRHLTEKDLYFPYLETGYSCRTHDPYTSKEHSHDFYELIYCMSGAVTHTVDGKKYVFPENSIFIIAPNTFHYFSDYQFSTALTICINSETFKSHIEIFSLEDVTCFDTNNFPLFLKISSKEQPFFRNLCRHIYLSSSLERVPYSVLFINRALSCIFQENIKTFSVPSDFFKAVTEMEKIENAREGISAFLRMANVSHTHLCRLTSKYLGTTPHEYINRIRLQYAHAIILEDDIGFEEIATIVGFSSYPHFCKLFKKAYHISPSQVRLSK